jgi:hypothetical protein
MECDVSPLKKARLNASESMKMVLEVPASANSDSSMTLDPPERNMFFQIRRAHLAKNKKLRTDIELKLVKLKEVMTEVEESARELNESLIDTHEQVCRLNLQSLLADTYKVIERRNAKSLEYKAEAHKLQQEMGL